MPYEISITELKTVPNAANADVTLRVNRLTMIVDEMDLQSVIKQITAPKRKRNAKKASA